MKNMRLIKALDLKTKMVVVVRGSVVIIGKIEIYEHTIEIEPLAAPLFLILIKPNEPILVLGELS